MKFHAAQPNHFCRCAKTCIVICRIVLRCIALCCILVAWHWKLRIRN